MGGRQMILWGGSEPIEALGEVMGKRKIVLSKVVHARVTNAVSKKLQKQARESGVTVSKLVARILAEA